MADLDEQVRILEIKFATSHQQFISLHQDNKRLLEEVGKLSEKVSEMNNEFSKGKGVIIGVCIFVGSIFTVVNQYFNR